LNNKPKNSPKLISVIGYGTFITQKLWKDKPNIEVCLVRNFSRIYPPNNWFPYVLPSKKSFRALKFEINEEELKKLDQYEGVPENIFERINVQIILKNGKRSFAFLYVPTYKTISTQNLTLDLDLRDRWKEELKKYPEIIKKFPELIL
jgi:gamma-glutamylcyclotransferase (GGCT)/AIG2-like uncharacterized protein YtfP